jgi:CTP:molybdopterin cytidylyltransferase MocA
VQVEFIGALGGTNVAAMTHTDSLTGGSSPAVAVTTPTGGVAGSTGNERYVTVVPIDAAGAPVSATVRAAVVTYLDGLREVSFIVAAGTPTYTTSTWRTR